MLRDEPKYLRMHLYDFPRDGGEVFVCLRDVYEHVLDLSGYRREVRFVSTNIGRTWAPMVHDKLGAPSTHMRHHRDKGSAKESNAVLGSHEVRTEDQENFASMPAFLRILLHNLVALSDMGDQRQLLDLWEWLFKRWGWPRGKSLFLVLDESLSPRQASWLGIPYDKVPKTLELLINLFVKLFVR